MSTHYSKRLGRASRQLVRARYMHDACKMRERGEKFLHFKKKLTTSFFYQFPMNISVKSDTDLFLEKLRIVFIEKIKFARVQKGLRHPSICRNNAM